MDKARDITITVDCGLFFHIGRALQRGIGKKLLGEVTFTVTGGKLTIESGWGGGELVCSGGADIAAKLSAKSFCQMIRSGSREKQPCGEMQIVFRPEFQEVAIDRVGVNAKFL